MRQQRYWIISFVFLIFILNGSYGVDCAQNLPVEPVSKVLNVRDAAACLISAQLREVQVMSVVELMAKGCRFDLKWLESGAAEYAARLKACTDYHLTQLGKINPWSK